MKKVYIVSKTRLGAASSTAHELLIAKFRFKLKKVGKNTRPIRYDVNPIPYDYTVEVTNRFKGLDLIGGSDGKASVYNAGDPGSIPGLGRSTGEGNGNPLQYYCLENLMDRGAW